jgi:hypothetical protein
MNEASLKSELVRTLRKELLGAVVFRHEDKLTSGIPDISVTWHKKTTWLEAKYLNPHFHSKGIQELTVRRLSSAGSCFYVLYTNIKGIYSTTIVDPYDVVDKKVIRNEMYEPGILHQLVVRFIRQTHGN